MPGVTGLWDGSGLWQDSGWVQPRQGSQAGRWAGLLGRSDPSDGRVGLQDETGQGLSQVTFPRSLLCI